MLKQGITYMHEHVFIDLSQTKTEDSCLDCFDDTVSEFKKLKSLGVTNILEVTNIGMGRNIEYMENVKKESGINILYCTGFYQDKFFSPSIKAMTEDEMYKLFVKELTVGIDNTNIKASAIGEIGTSKGFITETEEQVLAASIKAHLYTGAAITTHCTLGTMGHEQIAIFKKYTNDLSNIVIGHTDLTGDEAYIEFMLEQGVNVAFDTVGKIEYMPDTWRVKTLKSLIEKGYENQIVLSLDITRKSHLNSRGGLGYAYLIQVFIPMLKEASVSDKAIDSMLIYNPKKILEK